MKAKLIRALEFTLSNDSVFNKECIPNESYVQTVRDKKFWINLTSPVMMKVMKGTILLCSFWKLKSHLSNRQQTKQARIWKRFWVEKFFDKFTLSILISSSAETWKIFRNMLCQFFFAWADILSERNAYFGKHLFWKIRTGQRVQTSFVYRTSRLVRISLLISALNKRVFLFFSGKLFHKSNRRLFPVFAYPDINIRGAGRILDRYANPRRSRILPTAFEFISGYANTENVFYCLNI